MAEAFVTGTAAALGAIDRLIADVAASTRAAVAEGAQLIQRQAQDNSSGRPGPNVVSGAHRAGIVVQGPTSDGPGSWVASVYPTMPYSRALEEGHPRWAAGVRYPYLGPAVMQVGPRLEPLFDHAWSAAIRRES